MKTEKAIKLIEKSNINTKGKKILVVENLCSSYRVGLFELLDKIYDIRFLFFSSGEEVYYDGERLLGNFNGKYVWGFYILPKIKINPKLICELLFSEYTHIIKSISGPVPIVISFFLAQLRRKKFILWTGIWHHPKTLFHRISFPFLKYLYLHSHAIIVYGLHVKRYLLSLGIPSEKISIAWQVQDNSKFQSIVQNNQKKKIKTKIGVTTQRLILFVGRLVEQKGVMILLEAFRSLNVEDVSLLIIGRGALQKTLLKEISFYDRVFHISHVPNEELYLYYAISDIFVLPSVTTNSFKEPWGFVINEAMCQGCAIITSDAVGAGVGGLLEEGGNGYIVPENNSEALKEALEKLLNDEQLLRVMKKRSKKIIKDWTYSKMANGFITALEIADKNKSFKNRK